MLACVPCVPGVQGDQKKMLALLELELQVFVSFCVGEETQTQTLSASMLNAPSHWAISSVLYKIIFHTMRVSKRGKQPIVLPG